MTHIDQFESVFRAADKAQFVLEEVNFQRVLVVTDLDQAGAEAFIEQTKRFLPALRGADIQWTRLTQDDDASIQHLLKTIDDAQVDLICTYRNLHLPAAEHPHSLGVHLDVLTQTTDQPVLVFPSPHRTDYSSSGHSANVVMAITDHLADQPHLVNVAANCVAENGALILTHIEDKVVFERYLRTIGRIPEIDTDLAGEAILKQLLKEPTEYIESCRERLEKSGVSFRIESIVALGHHLSDYSELIHQHDVQLLVMNTKDNDQLAMHGLAYPLSVELRDTALLLV
ncbi:MAG: hypothetical protein GY768_32500 [Planctomycetaceae bacterium]|nr:hypothetical protein [Planctomycetaceae bacterium]